MIDYGMVWAGLAFIGVFAAFGVVESLFIDPAIEEWRRRRGK